MPLMWIPIRAAVRRPALLTRAVVGWNQDARYVAIPRRWPRVTWWECHNGHAGRHERRKAAALARRNA